MILSGSKIINADRQTVWDALNDAQVLKDCVPGCQEMTGNAVDGFAAVVTQKIGPVKATFKGSVTITDVVVGESYRITGEGKGGVAGFAKGGAKVILSDIAGGTQLDYEAEAKVGGKLAQLGARLIDGVAKNLAAQFFNNLGNAVAPPSEPDSTEPATTPAAENTVQTDSPQPEPPKTGWFGWLKRIFGI